MSLDEKLTAVAEAIREKTGDTDLMTVGEMPSAIRKISTGANINDGVVGTDSTWSSDKINTELSSLSEEIDTLKTNGVTEQQLDDAVSNKVTSSQMQTAMNQAFTQVQSMINTAIGGVENGSY